MNLRLKAVQLVLMLGVMTAVHAADFQQVQIRGPKNNADQLAGIVYGPIESSDTLWKISSDYRPDNNLSIYQVMQAIYELNPDAFERNNLNLMKDGAMLKMPSARYIARVDARQAQRNAELADQALKSGGAISANATSSSVATVEALDQTKELIEEKLGAIDQAQNRQFAQIRKQFAESINDVQSILTENQKLFERLNKVNEDIEQIRAQEEIKAQQMNQMGESIEELLKRSRLEEAEKAAIKQDMQQSWLDNPVVVILLFTLPVLLVLVAFAIWMVKRKESALPANPEDEEDLALDPLTADMDDLSDALSAELTGKEGDDAEDDLFGEDDVLDDVLAEELEESLDDALEESLDESLVGDTDAFDDLGEEVLDDVLDDEFEVGAEVVEQDDLDSLFEEEDDLLAEVEEASEQDLEDDLADELLAEVAEDDSTTEPLDESEPEPEENLDENELLESESEAEVTAKSEEQSDIDEVEETQEIEQPTEDLDDEFEEIEEDLESALSTEEDDIEYEEDESLLAPVEPEEVAIETVDADEDEQPEISIDELLTTNAEKAPENPIVDDSEGINEEILQNLDQEISAQNEQLDKVTGSLIDELEQIEQMQSMLPDDEVPEPERSADPQLDIQTLDDLAEEIDEDLLTEDFEPEEDESLEVDISEVLEEQNFAESNEQEQLEVPESSSEPEASEDVVDEDEIEKELEQAEQQANDIESESESEADSQQPEQHDEADSEISTEATDQVDNQPLSDSDSVSQDELVNEQDTDADLHSGSVEESEAQTDNGPENDAEITPEGESAPGTQDELIADDVSDTELPDEIIDQFEPETAAEPEDEPAAPPESEPELETKLNEAEDFAQAEQDAAEQAESKVEDESDPQAEQSSKSEESTDLEDDDDLDSALEAELAEEFEQTEQNENTLDEDQLEKALEDFENEELDEVLEDLASNDSAPISSLDDLEFSADDFVEKDHEQSAETDALESIESDDEFDDSELEAAFDETAEQQTESSELDDMPGLGEWLGDEQDKQVSDQEGDDSDSLDGLEEASFDEMLQSIDQPEDQQSEAESDNDNESGLNIDALLDDTEITEQNLELSEENDNEEDFLDVESLLNDSDESDSDEELEKALDLDMPLEPFVNEQDNLSMVDVDADDGLGAKLDLALAYIEIGEQESAQELLDEIIENGNANQIAEAKKILDDLN